MLLLPQGWLLRHHFVLGCFAPRSVGVRLGKYKRLCVSGAIKEMRKCGEFKISLFKLRSWKIPNSTTSGRKPMGAGGGGGRGVF